MRWFMCAVILAVVVLGIIIVPGAADADRPAIIVAMAAVLVAALGILVQNESARQQRDLAEQQTRLTSTLQSLTLTPVITAGYKIVQIAPGRADNLRLVRNVGKGPAIDLRVTVFGAATSREFDAVEGRVFESLLAPGEESRFRGPDGGVTETSPPNDYDVWIFHCADMVGAHYHAWCNWTRQDTYDQHSPWMFDTVEDSPDTIQRNCIVCSRQGNTHSESPSES